MKRPNPHTLPPDFISKEKEALLRSNRIVISLNDKELEAIRRYQRLAKGKSRSSICREAIMEKVLTVLDENQPTLF